MRVTYAEQKSAKIRAEVNCSKLEILAKQNKHLQFMPSNKLFSFEISVNGEPLLEYTPEEDYSFPSRNLNESVLDRVSYVEVSPGSEFSVVVTYQGARTLSSDHAFRIIVFVDGNKVRGKCFSSPMHSRATINGILVADKTEQT
jgi:hypothetical protein